MVKPSCVTKGYKLSMGREQKHNGGQQFTEDLCMCEDRRGGAVYKCLLVTMRPGKYRLAYSDPIH